MSILENLIETPGQEKRRKVKQLRREARRLRRKRAAELLGLYLEDLLSMAGGTRFVSSAAVGLGLAAALFTAGVCLTVYALAVARASRTRKR